MEKDMDEDAIDTDEATEDGHAGKSNWLNRLLERVAQTERWDELPNECLFFPYACY